LFFIRNLNIAVFIKKTSQQLKISKYSVPFLVPKFSELKFKTKHVVLKFD
jgi:hypothetical protein